MATETELKLELDCDDMSSIAMLPWLNALADGPGSREQLESVYYDTGGFDLRDKGVSLRLRRVGGRMVQTIKAKANGKGGTKGNNSPFARAEWEHEIAAGHAGTSPAPDLSLAKGTALQPLVGKKLRRRLHPVFETSVRRCSLPLRVRDGVVELAIDRGHILAGGESRPVHEVELELRQGSPDALIEIAERLACDLPVEFGFRSKAERGYALAENGDQARAAAAVYAEPIALDPHASAADGFRGIGMACLRHVAANRDLVRQGDPEAIHQMRVGIRRLRAAMSLFKDIVRDAKLRDIKSGLRWLLHQLGAARDVDVLLKESVGPAARARPDRTGFGELTVALEARRAEAFDVAARAMDSDEYRRVILTTALWVSGGPWSRDLDPTRLALRRRPLTLLARQVLRRRARKIAARARKAGLLEPRRRHRLRIGIKKLRYATEFFGSLFPGRKAARRRAEFGKMLKRAQDGLGRLNDFAVHERLAGEFVANAASRSARAASHAMGFISGREQNDVASLVKQTVRAGRRLREVPPFWEAA